MLKIWTYAPGMRQEVKSSRTKSISIGLYKREQVSRYHWVVLPRSQICTRQHSWMSSDDARFR